MGIYDFQLRGTMRDAPGIPFEKSFSIEVPEPASLNARTDFEPLRLNDRMVFEGDSGFATSSNVQTYRSLIVPMIGGKLRMPLGWNQATGGQTTSQMVTQIAAVNATNPDLVVVRGGGNDDDATDAAAETTINNLQAMVEGYTSRFVVIGTRTPLFSPHTLTPEREARRLYINSRIRAMASDRVRVADMDLASMTDRDFSDGRHPNQFGLYKGTPLFANAINALIDPKADPLALWNSPDNVLFARGKDPSFMEGGGAFVNSDGGTVNRAPGSGTSDGIPNGWKITNPTSLSVTVDRVDRGDGTCGWRVRGSGIAKAAGRIKLSATCTRSPAAVAKQTNEQWIGYDQAADEQGVGNVGMFSTSSLDWTPGRSQDTGYAAAPGLPAVTGAVLRTAQAGAYGTSGLTSFTQSVEVFVQPGEVFFDRTFYKPYAALVKAG